MAQTEATAICLARVSSGRMRGDLSCRMPTRKQVPLPFFIVSGRREGREESGSDVVFRVFAGRSQAGPSSRSTALYDTGDKPVESANDDNRKHGGGTRSKGSDQELKTDEEQQTAECNSQDSRR